LIRPLAAFLRSYQAERRYTPGPVNWARPGRPARPRSAWPRRGQRRGQPVVTSPDGGSTRADRDWPSNAAFLHHRSLDLLALTSPSFRALTSSRPFPSDPPRRRQCLGSRILSAGIRRARAAGGTGPDGRGAGPPRVNCRTGAADDRSRSTLRPARVVGTGGRLSGSGSPMSMRSSISACVPDHAA